MNTKQDIIIKNTMNALPNLVLRTEAKYSTALNTVYANDIQHIISINTYRIPCKEVMIYPPNYIM